MTKDRQTVTCPVPCKQWELASELRSRAIWALVLVARGRQAIREGLAAFPGIDYIGEAENRADAWRQIVECLPDLVFLDLEMPGMSSFEVIRQMIDAQPPIVVPMIGLNATLIQALDNCRLFSETGQRFGAHQK